MKGFIEVTAKDGRKRLINITRIEEVINSKIYLDVINLIAFECEESYEEIKAKIAEAVEDKIFLPKLKKDEELIEWYYENANKKWIIT